MNLLLPRHLTQKQIKFQGYTVSYLEGGINSNSSSEPILFLHGWALSAQAFQDSLHTLSAEYRVIAPDLPGFGKSSCPKLFSNYWDYANFIIVFAQALNLEKVHIIGQSLGGGIALQVAALEQSLVRSLILLDSAGVPIGSFPDAFLRRLREIPAQAVQTNFCRQHLDMFQSALYNCFFNTQNTLKNLTIPLEQDLRPILAKIEAPCLLVWGERDLLTPLSSGRELAQHIKGSQMIVIEGAYHEWSLLLPKQLVSIVIDFLSSTS